MRREKGIAWYGWLGLVVEIVIIMYFFIRYGELVGGAVWVAVILAYAGGLSIGKAERLHKEHRP